MIETFNWFGEEFTANTDDRTLSFVLRQPMQMAGTTFKWNKKLGEKGIGLNTLALRYAKMHFLNIIIIVGNIKYSATPEDWIEFSKSTNSILQVNSATIYVLPWCEPYFKTEGSPQSLMLSDFFG